MPNPAAIGDRIEGTKTDAYNFFAGIGNMPVESHILNTPFSLHSFGVPLIFDYGEYQNTNQRLAGFKTQFTLTVVQLLLVGSQVRLKRQAQFQFVVQIPMIGMNLEDILVCGNTFTEFLSLQSKN